MPSAKAEPQRANKAKIGVYWAAACGGCDCSLLEVNEQILDVAAAADIYLWPCAADAKYSDLEGYRNGELDIVLFNGAIRTAENREIAELIRAKTKYLVAFGSCAHTGGVIGLANMATRDELFTTVFGENRATWPQLSATENGHELHLPEFLHKLTPLSEVVEVDYIVPGCAPTPNIISGAVDALLGGGDLPPAGTVLAPDTALCDECERKVTKPEVVTIEQWKRPHEVMIDEELCLLAQGLVCLGPATRAGCGSACIGANMPCSGCFGPTSRVRDHGGKALAAIASLVDSDDEDEIDRILAGIPDPVGTFYRYSLPASLLRRAPIERPLEAAASGGE